jgi:hypothetical protein
MNRPMLTWLIAVNLSATLLAQDKPATPPKVVKFPELVQAIQAHRGRVVVVDFWANY